jgi:formate hydrogenlyase subunit 3/multisubunit Na+/H+ antiporter MnhD subunit
LTIDRLAGLFLAVVGAVATVVALAFTGWSLRARHVPYRGLAAAVALTVAAVVTVLLADNAYLFLFGWEGLSLAFFLLSGYRRDRPGRVAASMLTFGFSKLSGALLLVSFGLLYAATGSFHLADWSAAHGPGRDAAYALALAGFAAKVGLVPVQIWMPGGYAAAPGPARALMSAVAANVGFYGMWRTLHLLGAPPRWLAVVVLIAAGITALLGIAHAAVQRDLQRVIAYSSVENGGLITAGFAVALVGAAGGVPDLVALGLLTGVLQMITHALAKASLFLATACFADDEHDADLERLRGAGRAHPMAGIAFSLGALSLAGMPLTVGFVSEWYLLESVMQLFRLHSLLLQISLAAAGALFALTVGLAGLTFVRLVGMTVLGPRSPANTRRRRSNRITAVALLAPALACVGLAAVSPLEIRFIARGLSDVVPRSGVEGALAQPWVLQPVFGDFSALSPTWLAVEMPVLATLVVGGALLLSRGSLVRVRRVPAWTSATGGVAGDAHYSPFAFANPARRVLSNVLLTRVAVADAEVEQERASVLTGPDLADNGSRSVAFEPQLVRPAEPVAWEGAQHHRPTHRTDVLEVVETFLYRPLVRSARRIVTAAKRIQCGRLDAYIAYMLLTVIALLAIVVGLS